MSKKTIRRKNNKITKEEWESKILWMTWDTRNESYFYFLTLKVSVLFFLFSLFFIWLKKEGNRCHVATGNLYVCLNMMDKFIIHHSMTSSNQKHVVIKSPQCKWFSFSLPFSMQVIFFRSFLYVVDIINFRHLGLSPYMSLVSSSTNWVIGKSFSFSFLPPNISWNVVQVLSSVVITKGSDKMREMCIKIKRKIEGWTHDENVMD